MPAPFPPLHPAAAEGYRRGAGAYDRGRPGWPAEAIACIAHALDLPRGARVLDLGAGTGKLSEALFAWPGIELIAIEPVAEMRATLRARVPDAIVVEGTAEAIPLAQASVDAVIVGQAFHWFDGPRALAEIHRVLRPRGGLALLWNVRDEREDWVARLSRLLDAHVGDTPRYGSGAWREAFAAGCFGAERFGPLLERHFAHGQHGDPDTFVARATSASWVAALPEPEQQRVADAVRSLLRTHPATQGRHQLTMPYRTEVFWCRRR